MSQERPLDTTESGNLHVVPRSLGETAFVQARAQIVEIGWKSILTDVVKTLEGTEPIYIEEKTDDGMFFSRVCFWLPLDHIGKNYEEMDVFGKKCLSSVQAQGQAARAALTKFEHSSFGTEIMDISRFLCEEMNTKCRTMLVQVGELRHGICILLDEWSRAIGETGAAYESFYSQAVEDICNSRDPVYREIFCDVAQRLCEIKNANKKKLKATATRFEEAKSIANEESSLISRHFEERLVPRAHEKRGEFPRKIKINMKIVLDEVINSLGWEKPIFTVTRTRTYYYVCEVVIMVGSSGGGFVGRSKSIRGAENLQKMDAVQSASMAAIFFLDKELSIQLADINFNRRSHAELYSCKAEGLVKLFSSIGSTALSEWEEMVNGLQVLDQYCRQMVADHPIKEPWDFLHNVKCDSADTVARLYLDCHVRLLLGKRRYEAGITLFEIP